MSGSFRLHNGEIVARERQPAVMHVLLRKRVAAARDVHLSKAAAAMDCFEVVPQTLLAVVLAQASRALGYAVC